MTDIFYFFTGISEKEGGERSLHCEPTAVVEATPETPEHNPVPVVCMGVFTEELEQNVCGKV